MVAAVLGSGAAAVGHVLDATGRLPFVHETADVRLAMHAPALAIWLVAAAVAAAVAATTRPLLVGAPAAVVVSATPELVGRQDPGALLEPGAVLGALLQLLLVLAVVAVAAVAERWLCTVAVVWSPRVPGVVPVDSARSTPRARVPLVVRPRGPPSLVVS